MVRLFSLLIAAIGAFVTAAPPAVQAQQNVRQYRAALTKIFLERYAAMAVVRLNPLFPGDVVQINNETRYLSHTDCYDAPVGKYRYIQDYREGLSIATSADLRVKGDLLSRKIAAVEAGGNIKIETAVSLTISPLSVEEVALARLRKIKQGKNCPTIIDLLDGKAGGHVVVQQVLHGKVNLGISGEITGALNASAQGNLIQLVSRVFAINEADVRLAANLVSFAVSESPQEMTLAFVPAYYSSEELARITLFMQGLRGAELEIAVREAVLRPPGVFEQIVLRVRDLLGNEELRNKEIWADRVVNGEDRHPVEAIKAISGDSIDFKKVADYGAAMELVREDAPRREQ